MYHNPEVELKTEQGETYLTLTHDQDRNVIYLNWTWKYQYGFKVIKESMPEVIDFVKKTGATGGLEDLRTVQDTWDPINEWIGEVWVPGLLDVGIKYWVLIEPEEFFAELSAELMKDGIVANGLPTVFVKSIEEGQRWIENNQLKKV